MSAPRVERRDRNGVESTSATVSHFAMERLPYRSLTSSPCTRSAGAGGSAGTDGPGRRLGVAAGFSLVEVLVAVVVLSVGLLGLAALQITGMRANDSAELRTTATLAAQDVADRLRADPASFFPLGQASRGSIAIAFDDCEGTLSGTNAVDRWIRDFCALGLPPPAAGDFARVDCGSSALNFCGSGNCAISVRWDDGRGDRRSEADPQGAAPAQLQFRFCTRIPTA